MRRQKTFFVDGQKIKIVSRIINGCLPGCRTNINGKEYYSNFEIMKDYKITYDHRAAYEEFIERAMERAYLEWVKNTLKEED